VATDIAILLEDNTILSGDVKTVALAFLMLEFAPVAFPSGAGVGDGETDAE
jgi:hypothetical protein